ncbi:hypothetical protein THAOC_07606, partial [Thalassiosira oceanica]
VEDGDPGAAVLPGRTIDDVGAAPPSPGPGDGVIGVIDVTVVNATGPRRELRVCRACESDGRSWPLGRETSSYSSSRSPRRDGGFRESRLDVAVSQPPSSSSRRREPPGESYGPEFLDWQPLVELDESSPGSYFSDDSDDLVEFGSSDPTTRPPRFAEKGAFLTEAPGRFSTNARFQGPSRAVRGPIP